MKKDEIKICVICGKPFVGWGNNPYPVADHGHCCDECNSVYVIPARIAEIYRNKEAGK